MNKIISEQIKLAMLAKNSKRLNALRGIKSQLDLLNTLGKEVTPEMQLSVLQKMVKQRKDSEEIYKSNSRMDLFEVEMNELSVIEEFLPSQASKEEIEDILKSILVKTNATSIKDMGKVMGMASKELAGKADNKVVADLIKELLSNGVRS